MTVEPGVRKPSTSSGECPPTQTVAPKLRKSCLVLFTCEVLMPHDGSGVRSGSASAGTRDSSGTLAGADGTALVTCRGRRADAELRPQAGEQVGVPPTCTVTVEVRSLAGIPNRLAKRGVMLSVTRYLPRPSLKAGVRPGPGMVPRMSVGFASQPRAMPQTALSGNGSCSRQVNAYGEVVALAGTARSGS